MKKISLAIVILLAATTSQAQSEMTVKKGLSSALIPNTQLSQTANLPYELAAQKFFNNQVTIQVPTIFFKAGDDFIRAHYPDAKNYPEIVLTDNSKTPMLALNMKPNYEPAGERQNIVAFFRDIKNDIRTNYPKNQFLRTDVVRNRTLGIIEVLLPNKEGKMLYNMMAFRYVGNNFFFLNFTCPEEEMSTWQDTAREIAETVKVSMPDNGVKR